MSMDQMRAAVAALYPGKGWKEKVARMPEGQILAIYTKRVIEGSRKRVVEGTFASAAGGRGSEQKGVAAVAEREGAKATDARCGNGNRVANPYGMARGC